MENKFAQSVDVQKIFQMMDFYAKYPNFRLFTGKKVYELHEQVRSLLQTKTANVEDQQKLHGNFIWKLKKYYGTPFQKEAVALINSNIKELNLSDADKLNYLNYLLSGKVYGRFHKEIYVKLSNVDFSEKNAKLQARHIFYKMKNLLAKKTKNKSEFADVFDKFEPFMQNLAQQTKPVSYKMLGEYAEVYFAAALHREYKEISLRPLISMLQHTTVMQAQRMPKLFDEPENLSLVSQIDKKAAYQLLKAYHDFSLQHEKQLRSNLNFHHAVTSMFCDIVQNFDYTANDVKNLRKALGSRHGGGAMQARLYESGLIIQRAYNQSHSRGVSVRNRTVQAALKNGGRWD